MTEPILVPGSSCGVIADSPRSGLLIDAHDYYRAFYDACLQAKQSILMLGWQFDTAVELVRGDEARGLDHPVQLLKFLATLCKERPGLEVKILAWRSSALFALEREPLQSITFKLRSHENLRFELDDGQPTGASQHQKVVIIDRALAMVGSMDICDGRWDTRDHRAVEPLRGKNRFKRSPHKPYHDVQAYVTGEAVEVLRGWFCERWRRGTGEDVTLHDGPRDGVTIIPTLEITVPKVGLTRTCPQIDGDTDSTICELKDLHLRAIDSARRTIYFENQYFCSGAIRRALEDRMRRDAEPLEIVMVLPATAGGLKEQVSIGVRQSAMLRELKAMATHTGHHLGVYYTAAPGPEGDQPVFIHAKVLVVDDRFLLVSSCNTTNRGLGLDSELGVAWETAEPDPSIRAARLSLLREHSGLSSDDLLNEEYRLVRRLDALARAKLARLRLHQMAEDDSAAKEIAHALDPAQPDAYEDILPEPDLWHRHVKDHLGLLWHRLKVAVRR